MARTKHGSAAAAAFILKKSEIDAMLARLEKLSAEHFHADPNTINWGHVGMLSHHAELLKRITDAAFHEGEFAD